MKKQVTGFAAALLLAGCQTHTATIGAAENKNQTDVVMAEAGLGDVVAQYTLGVMYDTGKNVTQDYRQAAMWYTKAAEQSYAKAQYNLGNMYRTGGGVTQDYQQAVAWYTKAAEQGNTSAQNNLGVMYANGTGVTQNYKQAYLWFSIAATDGDKDAINMRDMAEIQLTPTTLEEVKAEIKVLTEKIEKNNATKK